MGTHTPGPWHVEPKARWSIKTNAFAIMTDDRYAPAFVPAWDRAEADSIAAPDEAIANARLIAAAPEMLAALKAVANSSHQQVFEVVRAAIAKAEGAAQKPDMGTTNE